MSVTRYSREIDLLDLENVHTFAVLAVPPGSRVLDLGAGEGSVARALRARGCDVTAVERDDEGVAILKDSGVRTVHADLATLDEKALPRGAFDVVLLLDVLEHLVDPGALLARTRSWLAPGGRVLVSVPNVAHAAVRLSLLRGQFPRTDTGLLDRTHLHFFDQAQLQALLAGAELAAIDMLTVERGLDDTELPVAREAAPAGIVETIAADPLSRVYQFFVIAVPGPAAGEGGGLTQAVMDRLRGVQAAYRKLEDYAAHTQADGQVRAEALAAELRTSTDRSARLEVQVRDQAAHAAALMTARLADVVADRDTLRRQLAERMAELTQSSETTAVLLRDLEVQREFAAVLAAQVPRIAARGGESQILDRLDRFQAVAPTPAAAAALAGEAAEFRRLQGTVAFRALARLDAWSRRLPRVRAMLSRMARTLAGAPRQR